MKDFSLVYVIGTYPGLTTTFIDREIRAMRQHGARVRVLSIRRPQARPSAAQQDLQEITSYLLPPAWGRLILGQVRFALRRPSAYFGTLFELLSQPHPGIASRLRTFLHFLEGVYAAQLISEQACGHIHAHFADRASTVALVAGRLLNIPYSLTAHANDIYVKPLLLPLKFSRARFIATCTAYNKQHLAETYHLNGKLHCFHHGLDTQTYQPQADPALAALPLITSVGQLKEKKGFSFLLKACRILVDRGFLFHCQIIGEGPLRGELEKHIRDLGLEEIVSLRGALPNEEVTREYQRSALFVLPCITSADGDRDGIPNVILEAMATQVPVISTQHSGIPEVVASGVNGLLVPPSDAAALAEAIARLLEDPALRKRMGERGRQIVVEQFDAARNAHRLLMEMVKS